MTFSFRSLLSVSAFLVVLCTTPVVVGATQVRQWNPSISASSYTFTVNPVNIEIRNSSSNIYKFEAFDDVTGLPVDINNITVGGGVSTVSVMVHGDPSAGRSFGARNVYRLELVSAATSSLVGLNISGNLQAGGIDADNITGGLGLQTVSGPIFALTCSGTIYVHGDVSSTIRINGAFSGGLSVDGGLYAEVKAASFGRLAVSGPGPHTGAITLTSGWLTGTGISIAGTYAGTMTFPVHTSAPITIGDPNNGGSLTGTIRVNSSLTGSLAINQNLSGTVDIAGSPTYGGGNASGPITVGGDVGGSIHVAGQLTSGIFINGSLLNGPSAYDIDVAGMGDAGAVAIDYDGWHAGHDWATGAVVRVAGTSYTGNDTGARVYEITGCKGDLNNDGAVNWRDIDPLVAAMNDDPNYGTLYPGLGGSQTFHGDVNCDNHVNWRDIDPFVALQNQPCTLGCAELQELELLSMYSLAATDGTSDGAAAPRPNTAAGAGYTPAQTAALLYGNTTPDHRALLGYLIDQNAAAAPTTDLQDYWQAVAGFLPE